jgi:UDPglucose 6-dehydrogenase
MCLARRLLEAGVPVIAYDPAALDEARDVLGQSITYAASAVACARQADVLVLTVAWREFASLSPDDLRRPNRRPVVIDCWRVLNRGELESVANVIVLGMGPPPGANA